MHYLFFSRRLKLLICFILAIYLLYNLKKAYDTSIGDGVTRAIFDAEKGAWMAKHLAGDTGLNVVEWKRYRPDPRILYSDVHDFRRPIRAVRLLVVVLSAAKRRDRRDAIRRTWWEQCKQANHSITDCFFFTDSVNATKGNKTLAASILSEQKDHNDLITMPITSGMLFGYRFLYMIQWAWSRYDFDYLIRVDDDVMLCVNHLLHNIETMPRKGLHWGWLHCQNAGLVFMDEGVTMFSQDVVLEFLSQDPTKMHCHPYGDQTVTIWIQEIGLNPYDLYHPDQERIHHHPPASRVIDFRWLNGICDMYIALHGVYDTDMVDFWKRRGDEKHFSKFERKDVRSMCNHEPFMYWDSFDEPFYAQPKRCIEQHTWPFERGSFGGRENHTAEQDRLFSA